MSIILVSVEYRSMGMDGALRLDSLKEAAATVDAAALDEARFGFARAHPQRSARRVLFYTQALALAALITAFVFAARSAPTLTFATLHITALVIFAAAIFVRLIAAASLTPLLSRLADQSDVPVYTILCPLYREANVAPDLVAALGRIDYPGLMPQSVKSDTGGLSTRCIGPHVKEHMRYGDYRSACRASVFPAECAGAQE